MTCAYACFYRAFVPVGTWGDSAAPIVAGGMVHIALVVMAAADDLSQKIKFFCCRIFVMADAHHSAKRNIVERNPQIFRVPKTANRKPKIPIPNFQ